VKSSQNTQTSILNRARTVALIDPAIEHSYGNPGEKKRLPLSTKPNSNSNPEIQGFKMRSATAKLIKNVLAEPPLKVPYEKVTSKSLYRLSI
jgi:hypothetical protein